MIDKPLEEKIKQLKDFIELWASFYTSYKRALEQPSFSDEEEKNFLELKSVLARRYQGLMDALGIKPTAEDRTFDVISQVMSLRSIVNLSPLQLEKLENDWHNSYITLNKVMGSLENKKIELAKISPVRLGLAKFFCNPIITLLLIMILITGIFYLLQKLMPAG